MKRGGEVDRGGEKKKTKTDWTPAEDAILAENVERHWKGSWKVLQERTGLPYSSKACRLRWVNHHRPGLITGEFTPEEETRIRSLLDELGQKWTDIATHFPGRTDSEVKNFWYRVLRPKVRGRQPRMVQKPWPVLPPLLPSLEGLDFIPLPEYSPRPANPLPIPPNGFASSVLGIPMVPLAAPLPPASVPTSALTAQAQPPPGNVDLPHGADDDLLLLDDLDIEPYSPLSSVLPPLLPSLEGLDFIPPPEYPLPPTNPLPIPPNGFASSVLGIPMVPLAAPLPPASVPTSASTAQAQPPPGNVDLPHGADDDLLLLDDLDIEPYSPLNPDEFDSFFSEIFSM